MITDPRWKQLAQGDADARDALLREHLSLVHHVSHQLSRSLSANIDFDELVSCGTIGLMNALAAFEPARGLAFSTFAVPRIRGAILDELRRQDHVPRSIRRKDRDVSQARERLTHTLGREPSQQELADGMGVDVETLWSWRADHEWFVHVSLDEAAPDSDGGSAATLEAITACLQSGVDDDLNHEQEVEHLQRALGALKEQERTVLTLYYFEELKLHEIAAVLRVTESRVSQIRTKALGRLREALAGLRVAVS